MQKILQKSFQGKRKRRRQTKLPIPAPMQKILYCFQSQTNIAEALGKTPQAVNYHFKKGYFPFSWAVQLEQILRGKVTIKELCPYLINSSLIKK